jgi:hypothetical protein
LSKYFAGGKQKLCPISFKLPDGGNKLVNDYHSLGTRVYGAAVHVCIRSNKPPQSVFSYVRLTLNISASASIRVGPALITVTVCEAPVLVGAEVERVEFGAKGDWTSGFELWGWGWRVLRFAHCPEGLALEIGMGIGVMVKNPWLLKMEAS